ncbi:hypothetical protein GCM10028808_71060 [Spirosoma migulaei]
MHYLILDTNIWIYLASSYDPKTGNYQDGLHFKLLTALKKMVEDGRITILTTNIIKEEWNRNRSATEGLIQEYQKKIDANKANVKHFKKYLEETDAVILDSLHQKFAQRIEQIISNNEQHIIEVEYLLFNHTEEIEIEDKIKIIAADFAVQKKAPFKGNKSNSMADAYILLSAVEYLKKRINNWKWDENDEDFFQYPSSFFVTANKGDFSNSAKIEEPDEDLKGVFDSVKMHYRINLATLLNELEDAILKAEELEEFERLQDEYERNLDYCDVCSPDDEHVLLTTILFNSEIAITHEIVTNEVEAQEYDPNQLTLFNEIQKLPAIRFKPSNSNKESVPIGNCNYCGTAHIKCYECQSAVALLDNKENNSIECEDCGLTYKINYVYVGDGEHDMYISIVDREQEEE